jgi:hypothetical protein
MFSRSNARSLSLFEIAESERKFVSLIDLLELTADAAYFVRAIGDLSHLLSESR